MTDIEARIEALNKAAHNPALPTLLVVEDNIEHVLMLDGAIKMYGAPFNVAYRMSGAGAYSAIVQNCFDGVVLDLDLPDTVGTATAVKIRQVDCDIPILIYTGYSRETAEPYINLVGADYLRKGELNPEQLIARFASLAKHRRCDDRDDDGEEWHSGHARAHAVKPRDLPDDLTERIKTRSAASGGYVFV